MLSRSQIACGLGAVLVCTYTVLPCSASAGEEFAFYHENVMGTSLELLAEADSPSAARAAEERVLAEIDRLSAIFSSYDRSSELSRWQSGRDGPVRISPDLFEVLAACEMWGNKSGWAFDPRAEALSRIWSRAALEDRVPDAERLTEALALLKCPAWRLDPLARTATRLSACPLSLNGIAKGYIVERACDAAHDPSRGVASVLLNVGGDLRARGERAHTIGIACPWADSESSEPMAYIAVRDRSVATSGSSQRGFRIGGKWYSHVFDPRSGMPVERIASATVVAGQSMDADALAKIVSILDPEASLRLADSLGDVAFMIVERDGVVRTNAAWNAYRTAGPARRAVASPAGPSQKDAANDKKTAVETRPAEGAAWPAGFELAVNFEINRPEATEGRYRRPYVAIWVEDKNGFPVRTLALWISFGGAGPFQWLPDLKRWYKGDIDRKRVEKKEILFIVSRPTRPPGRYKVIWDGKDNQGRPLPAGDYTVTIEAAREHGTYQSIRKRVRLGEKPFSEECKGNVEIKSASIEYRRSAAPGP
jgi:thiamine biosynthesis lipoprotein ApbE